MSERWGVYVSDVADKDAAKAELAELVEGTQEFSGHLYHVVSGEHCMATTGCGPRGRENADNIARLPLMIEALGRIQRGPVQPAPDTGAHSWQANASFWRAECLRLMSLAREVLPELPASPNQEPSQ